MPAQATSLMSTDKGWKGVILGVGVTRVEVGVGLKLEFGCRGVPAIGLPPASCPIPP